MCEEKGSNSYGTSVCGKQEFQRISPFSAQRHRQCMDGGINGFVLDTLRSALAMQVDEPRTEHGIFYTQCVTNFH